MESYLVWVSKVVEIFAVHPVGKHQVAAVAELQVVELYQVEEVTESDGREGLVRVQVDTVWDRVVVQAQAV